VKRRANHPGLRAKVAPDLLEKWSVARQPVEGQQLLLLARITQWPRGSAVTRPTHSVSKKGVWLTPAGVSETRGQPYKIPTTGSRAVEVVVQVSKPGSGRSPIQCRAESGGPRRTGLDALDGIEGAHNPKVGGSDPPAATKRPRSAHCCPEPFRVRPDFYRCLRLLEAGRGPVGDPVGGP
jgi:hypothetical protein